MYGGAASFEAVASVTELRQSLEEQARELDAVLSRFTRARLLVPPRSDDGWRGLAQLFYDWALARLVSDLDIAQEQLTAAVRQTRRALESLDNRVG